MMKVPSTLGIAALLLLSVLRTLLVRHVCYPLLVCCLAAWLSFPLSVFPQGPLAPPGAPTPSMKSLDQIQPRTDLFNAPSAAVTTSNSNYHYIINQPGSYYLTGNLDVTKTNGIQINAEGVTLDLNGFQVDRASGSGGNGIELPATSHRASIVNGSIKGFSQGIVCLGVAGAYARDGRLINVSVANCSSYGIYSGLNWLLDRCVAHDCSATYTIYGNFGSTLIHCAAHNNSGTYAIFATNGCVLTGCNASKNSSAYGIGATHCSLTNCNATENSSSIGITVSSTALSNCVGNRNTGTIGASSGIDASDSVVDHCEASGNMTANGTPTSSTGVGISAINSIVSHCVANNNQADGIQLNSNCFAMENHCANNALGGGNDGAGIHATGTRNRIEANNVSQNKRGIDVTGTGNLIIKNTAANNLYNIVANNRYGPIVDLTPTGTAAVNGVNTAPATTISTDPQANFALP